MPLLQCYLLVTLAATVIASGDVLHPRLEQPYSFAREFDTPSPEHRPKFRYWLPDAEADHDVIAKDILALKNIGAGGLEFVPFYNYGFGGPNVNKSDVYAFGKPAFRDVLFTALDSCRENGLLMDFALGASQGQGVPAEPLTPGLAVQLVYGRASVRGGEEFRGDLPAPITDWRELPGFMQAQEHFGGSRLVGVSAAGVTSTNHSDSGDIYIALHENSLLDLSEQVSRGQLTWRAPTDHDEYVLFALYERYTNQRSCVGVNTDIIANGSWVTDHFSSAGAKLVTEFWEKNLLDTEILELLKLVGQHSWEDSMEIQASLYWSAGFLKRFTTNRGYNPLKYLPLLFHQSTSFNSDQAPYNTTFYLGGYGDSAQSKYLQDYRLTLNEGYMEYLETFETWAQSLGLSHSCQVGYNFPVDILASVPVVSAPELESLGFAEVDQMLQFVGPAHLGRRNVISTEIGAVPSGAYSLTIPSLLGLFHDAFASGVNSMLIHGMSYGGEQPGSTWPGYTPFQFRFTELWSPKQPAWDYMAEMMNYTARNQFILQTGVAKKDIAFYMYKDPYVISTERNGSDIRARGFTYEYLSPANLAHENSTIQQGILDSAGAAYQALILDQQHFVTPDAAAKLVELAAGGLPLIVVGSFPNQTIGSTGQDVVSERISFLTTAGYPNVKFIASSDSLLEALDGLSIRPRVQLQSEPLSAAKDLYNVWRSDGNSDFLFLYNKGVSATFNITVDVDENKIPHRLNAWTGGDAYIAAHSRHSRQLSFQMSLQQQQTAIVAFDAGAPPPHILSRSSNIVQAIFGFDTEISALLDDVHAASLTLSDSRVREIPALHGGNGTELPITEIGPWSLTLQSWVPQPDGSESTSAKILLPLGPQTTLRPWSQIPESQNVSGVGIYTSSFTLPSLSQLSREDTVYIIEFGPVLNTLRAWINDKQLPAVDIFDAQLDISDYIISGNNSIRIEVASTLFNAVKARVDLVKSNGIGPLNPELYTSAEWQPHGLLGPVQIKTLRKVLLSS